MGDAKKRGSFEDRKKQAQRRDAAVVHLRLTMLDKTAEKGGWKDAIEELTVNATEVHLTRPLNTGVLAGIHSVGNLLNEADLGSIGYTTSRDTVNPLLHQVVFYTDMAADANNPNDIRPFVQVTQLIDHTTGWVGYPFFDQAEDILAFEKASKDWLVKQAEVREVECMQSVLFHELSRAFLQMGFNLCSYELDGQTYTDEPGVVVLRRNDVGIEIKCFYKNLADAKLKLIQNLAELKEDGPSAEDTIN